VRSVTTLLLLATLYSTAASGQANLSREQIREAGQAALRQKNYAEAVRVLEDGLKRFPGDRKLRVELGRAYLYDRQDDRAMQLFREVLQEEPSNREAKLQLARALGYRRDYEASNKLYRELLKTDPDDELASVGLIRNLMHQKRTNEARRELQRALARHPDSKLLQEYKQHLDQRRRSGEDRQRRMPELAGRKRKGRLQGTGGYVTDSAANRSWRFSQQFDHQIGHGLTSRLQVEERSLWKGNGPKANVQSGTGELRFPWTSFLSLRVGGGATRFADGSSRPLYMGDLELHPGKRLWLTTGFSRTPIYPTFRAAQFNLLAEGWHTHLEWDPGPWRLNLRWSRQHYSDGNRVQREGAELLRWIGNPHFALAAGYRFNHFHFSQSFHHGYFNPSQYQSHLGVAGIRFRGKRFRGEYLTRVGAESFSALPYQPAWELALRNRFLLGNWEIGGDYFYFHLAQSTGAFRAHATRLLVTYDF
jgi:tetratricopeptide (TPR) repeat protein